MNLLTVALASGGSAIVAILFCPKAIFSIVLSIFALGVVLFALSKEIKDYR